MIRIVDAESHGFLTNHSPPRFQGGNGVLGVESTRSGDDHQLYLIVLEELTELRIRPAAEPLLSLVPSHIQRIGDRRYLIEPGQAIEKIGMYIPTASPQSRYTDRD